MPQTISPKIAWSWMLAVVGSLLLLGLVLLSVFSNRPQAGEEFPVQGFDVSHHQGDIDWKQISPKRYQFVYLKATEGGDFQDRKFQHNWLAAREQGLRVGAYHFYRLCRNGAVQADNFIQTVPHKADALAPVIDLEYDSNCINTYTKEQLLKEIQLMHDRLKTHYGKPPIFYVSKNFYHLVLTDSFPHTLLWIRDYDGMPELKDKRAWSFWQYSRQGKIKGIPKPVDLNAYRGSPAEWQRYLKNIGLSPEL